MRAPVLAVGDGAIGFWKALRDVWPETREQRCWVRTGNVIESPFATVRLRQRVTKGAGSRQKGPLMAFQLLSMAERCWWRINAPHLVPLVRAGIGFRDGVRAESRDAA